MDKNRKNIIGKKEKNPDLQFWLKKTPEERINAVEFLRSQHYALLGNKSIPRFLPILHIRARDLADIDALEEET